MKWKFRKRRVTSLKRLKRSLGSVPSLTLRIPGLTDPGNPNPPKAQFATRDEATRAIEGLMLRFLRSPKFLEHIKGEVQILTAVIRLIECDQRHAGTPILNEETLAAAFPDDYILKLSELEQTYDFMSAVLSDYLGEAGAEISPSEAMGFLNQLSKDRRETVHDRVFKLVARGARFSDAVREVDPEYDQLKGYARSGKLDTYYKGASYSAKKYGKRISSPAERTHRRS